MTAAVQEDLPVTEYVLNEDRDDGRRRNEFERERSVKQRPQGRQRAVGFLWTVPLSAFLASISAPGRGAPKVSNTVPLMVPDQAGTALGGQDRNGVRKKAAVLDSHTSVLHSCGLLRKITLAESEIFIILRDFQRRRVKTMDSTLPADKATTSHVKVK
jgi:hypothetical protein